MIDNFDGIPEFDDDDDSDDEFWENFYINDDVYFLFVENMSTPEEALNMFLTQPPVYFDGGDEIEGAYIVEYTLPLPSPTNGKKWWLN